jgi:ubiquinone/menaquinone biosynthesis C-methylase UbiE
MKSVIIVRLFTTERVTHSIVGWTTDELNSKLHDTDEAKAMTDAAHPEYVLGHAASELERLISQAAFYGDLTAHTLKLAGLGPGMRVLDVGCGAGDVSFLAASFVGSTGSIVGIDQNADAVAFAQSRVKAAGLSNVSFDIGDITKLTYEAEFDAVIGRLVLLYLGDPVAGVRAFSRYVKPGGLIYFQEFCPPGVMAVPPIPVYEKARHYIDETFARAKITLYTGMHLARIYRDAGLPTPSMLGMSRVESGPDSPGYEYIAQTVRSLLPLIEKTGVASAAEVQVDTLASRIREQVLAANATFHLPELIAGWTRVPA